MTAATATRRFPLPRLSLLSKPPKNALTGDVFDVLDNQIRGGADAADGQEDVVGHEVGREPLDLLGERGREEQRLALARAGHVLLWFRAKGRKGEGERRRKEKR